MTLVKRNHSLFPSFDSLFNDFFNEDFFPTATRQGLHTLPAVNVREEDGNYQLELAAPGMSRDDFQVEVDRNVLTISSKREDKHEEKDEAGNYTRREFRYHQFSRSFTLPESVDSEGINAKYEDGVLYVLLPKKAEEAVNSVRTIEIG